MIWPFNKKKLDIENNALKNALDSYEKFNTPQNHLRLLQELNTARYLIPSLEGEGIHHLDNGEIDPATKFNFLLSSNPQGLPLLAVFTDMAELKAWSAKAGCMFVLSPQQAWSFISPEFGITGVIVNPAGAGYVMQMESIEWLKNHPL